MLRFSSSRSWAAPAGVALVLSFATPAGALTIDSFDSGAPFVLQDNFHGASISQSADVLGGIRDVSTISAVAFDPSSGLNLLWISIGVLAPVVDLSYHPLDADLTDGGADRFQLTIVPTDPMASVEAIIFINNGASAFVASPVGGGVFEAPFNGVLGVKDVTLIHLEFQLHGTFQVSPNNVLLVDFRTVPELPLTLATAIAGLSALAVRRRAQRVN